MHMCGCVHQGEEEGKGEERRRKGGEKKGRKGGEEEEEEEEGRRERREKRSRRRGKRSGREREKKGEREEEGEGKEERRGGEEEKEEGGGEEGERSSRRGEGERREEKDERKFPVLVTTQHLKLKQENCPSQDCSRATSFLDFLVAFYGCCPSLVASSRVALAISGLPRLSPSRGSSPAVSWLIITEAPWRSRLVTRAMSFSSLVLCCACMVTTKVTVGTHLNL